MEWSSLKYVTGGLTLVAFLALLVARTLRSAAKRDKELIEQAPVAERARLIEQAIERYHFDTSNVRAADIYKLVREQLRARELRFRSTLRYSLATIIVFVSFGAYAIWRSNHEVLAQVTIAGVAVDASGSPVDGASLTVEGRDVLSESASNGAFRGRITRVTPGEILTVMLTKAGFKRSVHTITVNDSTINMRQVVLEK